MLVQPTCKDNTIEILCICVSDTFEVELQAAHKTNQLYNETVMLCIAKGNTTFCVSLNARQPAMALDGQFMSSEQVIGTVYPNLYLSVRNSLVVMKSINN